MPDKYEDMCDKALAGEQRDNRESNIKERIKELTEQITKPMELPRYPPNDTGQHLTFAQLREANVQRCNQAFHKLDRWNLNDWATATVGEIGEAVEVLGKMISILNTAKKIARLNDADYNPPDTYNERFLQLRKQFARELADIIIYSDLTAARFAIDLDEEIVEKFNEVSDKRGSTIKL